MTSIWKGPADQQPVDVEIILAQNEHARPHLEKLSDEAIVPMCSAVSASDIRAPRDLLRQKPIHIMGFDDHWARYLSACGLKSAISGGRLITDTSTAAMEMVAAGLGCAVVVERFARQAIGTGREICIVGEPIALGQSHYLVRREPHTNAQPGVDAFETWLRHLL